MEGEIREGESLLIACARLGVLLPANCGGRGHCGKCKVQVLEGEITGDAFDSSGCVRACLAIPQSGILIAAPENQTLDESEESRCIMPGKKPPTRAAVALDIGTTTVSASLIDLETSASLVTVSELNCQKVFGADVMSRIDMARRGHKEALFSLINRQTERILKNFLERWELKKIEKLSVSGNTTMLHFFINADPSGMGEAPFTPEFLEGREISGETLSLSAEKVTILPSISAFIGGDITAGLAALDIMRNDSPTLLIDIGTNGEMALFNNGKILCCATAAGPCFEGAEISCGTGGIRGAISGVEIDDEKLKYLPVKPRTEGSLPAEVPLKITTIGNVAPKGICGSGLIDAVALMLKEGIIDETGLMNFGKSEFVLTSNISITNKDIRQFQLAKSAILSGIQILCKRAGLGAKEIKQVFVTGGFGFFINKSNAAAAGLFPKEFPEKITVSGNLSLRGAEESIISGAFMEKCKKIVSSCSVIDLSKDPDFMEEFANNMSFEKQ